MFKQAIIFLLENYPSLESMCRKQLEKYPEIKKRLKRKMIKNRQASKAQIKIDKNCFLELLRKIGIRSGDLVMVHSDLGGLRNIDLSPKEIINCLLESVGEKGTIVFPVFQYAGKRNMKKINGEQVFPFNKNHIIPWTGILPYEFLSFDGIEISDFPLNTLAAKGDCAKEMMVDNMKSDLPHGMKSSWYYCLNHNAKILFLGLKAKDACTVMHCAEDMMDDTWPVNNWWDTITCKIDNMGTSKKFYARLRAGKWARCVGSYHLEKVLRDIGVLKRTNNGILIECIDNPKKFVDFLILEAKKGKFLYKIEKKDLKKV